MKIEIKVKNIPPYTNLKTFLLKTYSKNLIYKLANENKILINHNIKSLKTILKDNDIITLDTSFKSTGSIIHNIIPLDIVYEDKYYIVINKPSGLCSTPSKLHPKDNLASAVCAYIDNENFIFRILNRLDKDTSGLVIVAKDYISYKEIKDIKKIYFALATGTAKHNDFTINKNIKTLNKIGKNVLKRIIADDGKQAITHVIVIKQYNDYFLCSIQLEYGRTHQIRLHLSSINHALLGDEIYGKSSNLINHTALICKQISFFHYILKKTITLEVDFPKDFEILL